VQGSLDRDQVADASANWVDLGLVTAASDSPAAIPIVVNPASAGTSSAAWLSGGGSGAAKAPPRLLKRLRVVTSANTNVTSYRVEATSRCDDLRGGGTATRQPPRLASATVRRGTPTE
jgi:hypothetical protein